METIISGRTLRLVEGDITELKVDAIVNAANQFLLLGSGVAGAIRQRGGPSIQEECDRIGECPVGEAVITGGGRLPARYVIHAVGPYGTDPQAEQKLASATRASLALAEKHGLKSIAFPAISTGVFGYPIEECARVMLSQAIEHLRHVATTLELVIFCLYGQAAYNIFETELKRQVENMA